ncbi:Ribonuclease, T2 family [Phaffia rhodozyma]|uniref:ribonuclease T2 n=1 Tax=Phaffia rhodozyma TaxID=264483 RepID=A0A0F7SVY3_PHARH|nr:Ribonuclease, T2 family [Phaffia rhodozyma]
MKTSTLTAITLSPVIFSALHGISAGASPLESRATGLTVCSNNSGATYPVSCSVGTPSNTCCTESPGGHIVQTQFWDTAPATGPTTSWTVHGLWPDKCDGTFEQSCDPARQLNNITAVLTKAKQTDLLKYMGTYWKDYQGDDESFWEHEFNKHGTCLSTLQPKCFNNFYPQQDAITFFNKAVSLFKTLPSYTWLAAAGITPSPTKTYTLAQISAALEGKHGGGVTINCQGKKLNELWYHYVVQGSVADGSFQPAPSVGSGSTCPKTGIIYTPK